MRGILLLITAVVGLECISNAQVIRIPEDHPTIQAGINAAAGGDTILVEEGRYYENINFRGKAITLASRFILDGDTSHISKTIIDGSRPSNPDSASVVFMVSGEDTTSVLCGFTVTGGTGTSTQIENRNARAGGGVFIRNNGGSIRHNIIAGNFISAKNENLYGGGIFAAKGESSKTLVIKENIIQDNSLNARGMVDGSGMTLGAGKSGSILIRCNTIQRNRAVSRVSHNAHGGGVTMVMGLPTQSKIIFSDNVVSENEVHAGRAKIYGAGIHLLYLEDEGRYTDLNPMPIIRNNWITGNFSGNLGGGIAINHVRNSSSLSVKSPRPILINNTVSNNSAINGKGIYIISGAPLLLRNTFLDCSSGEECSEIFSNEQGLAYLFKNQASAKLEGRKMIALFGRYYLRHEKSNFKITGTADKEDFRVILLPPLWRTWPAFVLYGSLILLIFLWYRRLLLRQASLRTSLEIEKIEKEKIREIEQMRSRFFANISHEFRTPLTLLLGPLDDLVRNRPELAKEDRTLFRMMRRNVVRLKRLINQLLDLSKLESGGVRLQVSEGNLTEFANRFLSSFLSLAESKQIQFDRNLENTAETVYFDPDKLEKILSNLLSNAFKYTPEQGRVGVHLRYLSTGADESPEFAQFTVEDTGQGIPEDQIGKIFDRFYQASSYETKQEEGTGIGLSLTREMVELYRGEIRVESEPGKGSTFTVKFPVSKAHFRDEEIVEGSLEQPKDGEIIEYEREPVELEDSQHQEVYQNQEDQAAGKDGPLILIVEDNRDLRKFIAQNLSGSYRILEAGNGEAGMNHAFVAIPDLMISDLMMPRMDGLEMCRTLKSDLRTSHIPIILLTARADRESKLEGLETGADDYLTKPFDKEELRLRVKNLLEQRERLRERYRSEFLTGSTDIKLAPPDDQFLSRVTGTIEQHLQESAFNIESLSHVIGLSRSQLYRKMLALTGFTPVEYFRNFRLRHAARMFRQKHDNIAQVAYHVGFSNPSYFAECFRELFGSSPSEYLKKEMPS